jgi:peptidyl-dipeptidase Dcp
MNTFRDGSLVDGENIRPLVINCMNLTVPAPSEPTLLRFEEVETLFHEFGHALHALMSRVRYERFSGTSASPRDYVEFPSQLMEHFAVEPEVLAVYARHVESGAVIPPAMIEKLRRARTHNQGFKTVEYIAAALLDLAWHSLTQEEASAVRDAVAFEREVLSGYGLPEEIEPRYRSPYFAHIFSSTSGYSAGYYAYLWSAILDADGFEAFKEAGDIFDPELAASLAKNIYEAGYGAPGDELYLRFRGREPGMAPLMRDLDMV